jgi:hypothetical protein
LIVAFQREPGGTPIWSDRLIANKLGCHNETVQAVRRELEATDGIRQFDRLLGEDGKRRKNKRKGTTTPPSNGAGAPKKIDEYKRWKGAGMRDRDERASAGGKSRRHDEPSRASFSSPGRPSQEGGVCHRRLQA